MKGYRVLVCSAGTSPALGIVKCYRWLMGSTNHIVTTDLVADVGASIYSDNHYVVPQYSSPQYFLALQEIIQKERIQVVYPTHLDEIIYLSQLGNRLPKWYQELAVLNPPEVVLSANNKPAINAIWKQSGGLVPKAFDSVSEVKDPDFPLIAKPPNGASRGYENIYRIDNRAALEAVEERIAGMLIQQRVIGTEHSIDFVAESGTLVCVCARTRSRVEAGLSVSGTTVSAKEFMHLLEITLKILPHIGFGNLQIMRDEFGRDYLIEINPKLPGTLIHSAAAGLNMPLILADMKLGNEIKPVSVTPGLHMMRYNDEIFWSNNSSRWTLRDRLR
jgi:carbamoyl-phosphate synthase large subunit